MKKVLLMCLIVLGVSTLSKAQGGGQRGGGTPDEQLARYKTALTLTDDQSAKVLVILKAQAASNDSLTKAGVTDRAARMPIRTAMMAKMNAILTADQKAALAKMAQGGRGQGGGGGGGGGTPPPTR